MPKPLPLRQIESFNSMPNDTSPPAAEAPLPAPLAGLRVIEFSHMVMGPSCGMVLADLGADVVKIEPAPGGDNTRRLSGPAVGFFTPLTVTSAASALM
jgi:crotonobetainyl-CoA:carnitine CoA-transferase CaiB-like acyl-CoA transferase